MVQKDAPKSFQSLDCKRNSYMHTVFLWHERGSKQQDNIIQYCKLLCVLWTFEKEEGTLMAGDSFNL